MREDEFEMVLVCMSLTALLFQLYVLYLIQTKSHESIQNYKYFLNFTIVWDMLFTFLYGIVLRTTPVLGYFSFHGLVSYLGNTGIVVTLGLVFYCASNLLLSQLYSLIYRYTLLHDNPQVYRSFVSFKSKVLNLLLTQCFSVGVGVVGSQIIMGFDELPYKANYLPVSATDAQKEHLYFINMTMLTGYFFLFLLLAILIGCLVCLWLIWQIFALLRRNSDKLTKQTCDLHVQYTVLILLQILTLFFLFACPVILYICRALVFLYSSNEQYQYGLLILALCGPSNAILPVLCVTAYRQHIFNLITCNQFNTQGVEPADGIVPAVTYQPPNIKESIE